MRILRLITSISSFVSRHWEFLPAFLAELVPGVDLVPFWTLTVINVYRKWKQITITTEEPRGQRPALEGQQNSS